MQIHGHRLSTETVEGSEQDKVKLLQTLEFYESIKHARKELAGVRQNALAMAGNAYQTAIQLYFTEAQLAHAERQRDLAKARIESEQARYAPTPVPAPEPTPPPHLPLTAAELAEIERAGQQAEDEELAAAADYASALYLSGVVDAALDDSKHSGIT